MTTDGTDTERKELSENLRHEYIFLQTAYENSDTKVITIKSWGTLLISGAIAVGFKERSCLIFVATAFASIMLWYLEARWKTFQYSFIARINRIERWFRQEQPDDIKPFQIFNAWMKEYDGYYKSPGAIWKMASTPFVFTPYIFVFMASLVGMIVASLPSPPPP
ncbi:MAG: hypothetical protein EPN20_13225 [Magnetospirillum sp.]|nr:MAG: hypothetical protein EPN20_13225 [Magnetospirillum sp.]